MSSRNTDVNLIIRAKTEGERTIAALDDTLQRVLGHARDGTGNLAQLARDLAAIDKAAATLIGNTDKSGAALDRQTKVIAENRAALKALQQQLEAGARAKENLQVAIVDRKLEGEDTSDLIAKLKAAEREQLRLGATAERVRQNLANQATQVEGTRSSLLQLSANSRAVADAQEAVTARIKAGTSELKEREAATRRAAEADALRERVNRITGVTRTPATQNGAGFEALAEREKQAERERADAARREADVLRERVNRAGGVNRAPATDNGAGFGALEERFNRDATAAQRFRDALDPLSAIQRKLNEDLGRYRQLARDGHLSTEELAQSERHLTEEARRAGEALRGAGAGGRGLFGLRPHELQNLSYQVNDVVTGLATGQHLGQVVGQQGGQLLQLFPRVGSAIFSALTNPAILAAGASIGVIAIALGRAADEAERLRGINAQLTLNADGGVYDARKIEETQRAIRGYGADLVEAADATKLFTNEGVNPDRLNAFGKAAQELVEVTGAKLPDAAKTLTDAFLHSYEGVGALDDKLHFLTATQRENIRTLFEEGKAAKARSQAFDDFTRKIAAAAEEQRGNATDAARTFQRAYNDVLDSLSRTAPIQGVVDFFSVLARNISRAAGAVEEFPNAAARAKRRAEIVSQIAAFERNGRYSNADEYADLVKGLRVQLAEIDKQIALEAEQGRRRSADTRATNREAQRSGDIAAKEATDALVVAGQRRLAQERGVTTEKEKQARLSVAERSARAAIEAQSPNASDAAKNTYVAQARRNEEQTIVAEERAAAERRKREAEEQERERRRLAKQTRFIDPVRGPVTSEFGPRSSPGGVGSTFHRGRDFGVPVGTEVRAPAAGVVIETGYDSKLGKFVLIDHGNKVQSKFGHLSDNAVVRAGQEVNQGQVVAKSGNTGSATTGAHLHYTVLVNGKPVDPRKGLFEADGPGRFEVNKGQALQDYEDDLADRQQHQDEFNKSLAREAEQRELSIKHLGRLAGLSGEAVLNEERQQAVESARLDFVLRVEEANKNLKQGLPPIIATPEQIAEVERLAAATYDADNAKRRLETQQGDRQREIDTLTAQRDLLQQQAEFLRSIGDNDGAEKIEAQISNTSGALGEAIDRAFAFYQALDEAQRVSLGILDEGQFQLILERLRQLKQSSQEWGKIAGVSGQEVARAFAGAAVNAFTNFINKVAAGRNVFRSLVDGIREFASAFISSVAQMILQLLAYAAAVTILRALGVPVPTTGVPSAHTGGIAGQGTGQRRNVSPLLFAGAMRYHTGGIVGLAPDEVPIVARQGEEVLTEGNPRHRNNIGTAANDRGAGPTPVNIINAFDREEAAEMLLRTKTGERTIINIISDNKSAVKAALG